MWTACARRCAGCFEFEIWKLSVRFVVVAAIGFVSIAAKPALVQQSVQTPADTPIVIRLTGMAGVPPHIATPAHGALSAVDVSPLAGLTVTYTPARGYTGL